MTLSEILYEIAITTDKNKKDYTSVVRIAWQDTIREAIVDRLSDPHNLDADTMAFLKRCKIHWYKAKHRLEAENIFLFDIKEIRSFETFIYKEVMFKGIEYELLAKLKA